MASLILLILLSFNLNAISNKNPAQHKSGYTDRIIVKYKAKSKLLNSNIQNQKINILSRKFQSITYYKKTGDGNSEIYKLPSKMSLAEIKAKIKEIDDPDIEYIEPDIRLHPLNTTPNDTYYSIQWHYKEPGSYTGALNLPPAWDKTTGNSNIVIAVLDTGKLTHEDIDSSRVLTGYDMISDADIANDGDGRDNDPTDPGDWCSAAEKNDANSPCYDESCSPNCNGTDSSWHGLHVMGTIGAKTNNAIGVAGINWQSKILPVRVLGKGGGYTSDIADGILWAAGLSVSGAPSNSNPAKVINLSLGGEGSCGSYMQNAINSAVSAGSVIVVAAGNEDIDVSNVSPANCQNVIAVASIDKDGNKASYSNYGSKITISAPGADCPSSGCPQSGYDDYYIWSTYNDGKTSPTTDSYIGMQGTSMATPHISGLISLMFSIKPNLTPEEVLYNLTKSTRSFPSGSSCNTSICGSGMADAYLSLLNLETKINSINPSSAVVNSNVYMDIYGSGFMKNAQIKLKKSGYTDITADNVNVLNLNHINCRFPLSEIANGYWDISIINSDSSNYTLSSAFNVIDATPVINSISPNYGLNTGNQNITINGEYFQNGASAKISKGANETICQNINVASSNQINCVLPLSNLATGYWDLTVTNPNTYSSKKTNAFEVRNPPPSINSISTTSAFNSDITTITINGEYFQSGVLAKLTKSGYSDINCQNITVSSAQIVCSLNLINAPTGLWNLLVINPDGQSDMKNNFFSIQAHPPYIDHISPSSAPIYTSLDLHIYGNYFTYNPVITLQKSGFLDITAANVIYISSTHIICSIDLNKAYVGNWDLILTNPDGQKTSAIFKVLNSPPKISSISPEYGVNYGSVDIEITGSNFLSGASVWIEKEGETNINCSNMALSSNKIDCKLELTSAAAGKWDLYLKNPDGQYAYIKEGFTINNNAPKINSLSADTAINLGDFNLSIYGNSFMKGAKVKLSRENKSELYAEIKNISFGEINCVFNLKNLEMGKWLLSVINPDNQLDTRDFYILNPPENKIKIYSGIFNPNNQEKAYITTKINTAGKVSIKIYDQNARFVKTIFEGDRIPDSYNDYWSGINENGNKVSSGIYYIHIQTPDYKEIKRVVVVK